MSENLSEKYSVQADILTGKVHRCRQKGRMFVAMELGAFTGAVAMTVLYTVYGSTPYIITAVLLLGAYITMRQFDASNSKKAERLEALHKVYINELRYLSGDYSCFDDGTVYIDPSHAYSYDMDLFGKLSLFNRINRTVTIGGRDRLAHCLTSLYMNKEEIDRRALAVNRIAEMERERAAFMAVASRGPIDTQLVLNIISRVEKMNLPLWPASTVAFVAASVSVAVFASLVALSIFTDLTPGVPFLWATLQFATVLVLCSRACRKIGSAADCLSKHLKGYTELMRIIDETGLDNMAASELKSGGMAGALSAFCELDKLLRGFDRRSGMLGPLVFDTLELKGYFLIRGFLVWRRNYINRMSGWINDVSILDALVSMATFRYNEPSAGQAVISDEDKVVYNVKGLRHPFLGQKAVGNDFTAADGNYYIITGANMAGKSTFLRALGINYILAVNGMPVFADSMNVSLFNLFSSMRTNDDLGHGISYFNAELLRLRQLTESCKTAPHTLIILDEILKGTNSLDKLNGSRMFLEAVSRLPVTGIIATHDLELSRMADERPERFHNCCFEIELSDKITYTYRLTDGVARNQNATYLLRDIISGI
ncbi:MutS-related protein [Xylanibacter muris]|uniref:DNA mismatch repair protein MutS n=1 Tax=Xylanibacter muris TaxID=2736290 RepID=A0ABX2AP47_9BACT|nr:DNA mismatch repair protein MutS [Xylanibacter muris]NPD91945.1 DNA mismatch repair protein MutS [Xylanibacter muris]